jgi:hypothetical protein
MTRVISGLVLAVALFFAAPVQAQPVGTFVVAGDGYTGTVTTTQNGQAVDIVWTVGSQHFRGVGIFQNGLLSTGYSGEGQTGVALYREVSTGVWEGPYAFVGESQTHNERWTPQGGSGNAPASGGANTPPAGGAAPPAGTFAVTGEGYTGTVTVAQNGQAVDVVWQVGNQRFRGVGIFQNGVLSAGFTGDGHTGVALYRETSPGVWEGPWAFVGENQTHTERWTRQGAGTAPAPGGANAPPPAGGAAPPAGGATPPAAGATPPAGGTGNK